MKTFSAKAETTDRQWYVIDAQNQVVGRVAERAAVLLRGKAKAIFTPHVDTGDHVIVINAGKARFTGKKEEQKNYSTYSNFIGGQKNESPKDVRRRRPELLVERAIKGMIPHNRLGRVVLKKLHVYAGAEHPHSAQEPTAIKVAR
ncbi:MAG: 50S ribosomal protein L13 [Verrucomicrobiales bacterium]|jgi:large subunit ribosomal protein L13|nr:50S ribosomal protein L13 [Verrucomicrobiales bacterium]